MNSDDKLWAILCHLSIFIGFPLIIPLIVFLVKKQDQPGAAEAAKEALNFHISIAIYMFVLGILAIITMGIGVILMPFVLLVFAIFAIIAAVKAGQGESYRYPLTIRLVK